LSSLHLPKVISVPFVSIVPVAIVVDPSLGHVMVDSLAEMLSQ